MACHYICEISEALWGVSLRADVNVYPAAPCRVALGSCLAKSANEFLKCFDIAVCKDRSDHFALFTVRSVNAYVFLEFPLAPLAVPSGEGAVSVAAGGVFMAVRSEELSGDLRGFRSCYVVHLDLNAYGLVLNALNLYLCVFHCRVLRLALFSLSVCTY